MDPTITPIFIALSVISLAQAMCPKPYQLPIKYTSNSFFCARMYQHSDSYLANSCYGWTLNAFNGERYNLNNFYNDEISAIVVRPGCTLYVYKDGGYSGDYEAFTGVNHRLSDVIRNSEYTNPYSGMWWFLANWNDEISSYKCYCDFSNKALTCNPKQKYKVMQTCRNPSDGVMECEHIMVEGTEFGRSVTKGKSLEHNVEGLMGLALKQTFSSSLGFSTTSRFDWSNTDSKIFRSTTYKRVQCQVEPWKNVQMVELIGECGDTVVHTGLWECRETD